MGPGYAWLWHAQYPSHGELIQLSPRAGKSDLAGPYALEMPKGIGGDTLSVMAEVSELRFDGAAECETKWTYELR